MRDLVLTRMEEYFSGAKKEEIEEENIEDELARCKDKIKQMEQQIARETQARKQAEENLAAALAPQPQKGWFSFLGF